MKNENSNIKNLDKDYINDFCRKWNLCEFSVFGSFARNENREDSDIDILVDFSTKSRAGLYDLIIMQEDLEKFFNRKVDLLTKNGVEHSRNEYRKNEILKNRVVIYESR